MPSKNSGKTIKKIKINKATVSLFFEGSRMSISHDAYVMEGPLFVGKTLSDKDIKRLSEFTKVTKLYNYALSLLKKGHYSEWKIREKLYAKEASKSDVDTIVKSLKNVDLINDDMLIEDHLDYSADRCIGKNKIIKELIDKGIFEERVAKIKFPYKEEKRKALAQLPKLEKKYSKYSYALKKTHIFAALSNLGFEGEVINDVINNVAPKVEKDEMNKLKDDYKKTYIRLSKKYENKELNEKIIASLSLKGYRYSDIRKVMEANKYEDDFRIC